MGSEANGSIASAPEPTGSRVTVMDTACEPAPSPTLPAERLTTIDGTSLSSTVIVAWPPSKPSALAVIVWDCDGSAFTSSTASTANAHVLLPAGSVTTVGGLSCPGLELASVTVRGADNGPSRVTRNGIVLPSTTEFVPASNVSRGTSTSDTSNVAAPGT